MRAILEGEAQKSALKGRLNDYLIFWFAIHTNRSIWHVHRLSLWYERGLWLLLGFNDIAFSRVITRI